MAEAASGGEERTERVEERPGLTMVKRVTRKEDGRWLIYFDFERDAGAGPDESIASTSGGRV
jgi:hypothetical protein